MSLHNAIDGATASTLPPIPPRHAFARRRTARILLFAPVAGVIFATFAFIVLLDRVEVGITLTFFLFSGMIGLIAGVVCTPFVYFFLRNRDPDYCLPRAAWILIGVMMVVVLAPLDVGTVIAVLAFGMPACLVVESALLACCTPRIFFGVNNCCFCGYDLRGSVDVGRCPECGWRFDDRDIPEHGAPSRFQRAARWTARHPLMLLAVLVGIAGLRITYDKTQSILLRRQLNSAIRAHAGSGNPVTLGEIAPFDWDEAHVIGGYSTRERVAEQLGFDWPKVGRTGIAMRDDIEVLVFVKGRRVVRYAVPRKRGRSGIVFPDESPFTRDTAFRIIPAANDDPTRLVRIDADANQTNRLHD